jgi:UDP-2,3-diacylglucosamine pyrophosphatase LpxH
MCSDDPAGEPGGEQDVVVISDFHLGAGRDPLTGELDGREPFRNDAPLTRFLDHLHRRDESRGALSRMVVLGDLLDFSRVHLSDVDPAAELSDSVVLRKLDRIAAGHPEVFAALGSFAAAGHELHLVPGNHDFPLMRPIVGERLDRLFARYAGTPHEAPRVKVHPWVCYLPGVLYAEHGHQYHDLNWFENLLLIRSADRIDPARLPLGLQLERRGTGGRLALLRALARHLATFRSPRGKAARDAYREAEVREHAEEVGLPPAALAAVDRLAAQTARAMPRRLAAKALRIPAEHYMPRAARALNRILSSEEKQVPNYVFAHTHAAAQIPLGSANGQPVYLNAGTWSSITYVRGERAGDPAALGFVEISASGSKATKGCLMLWNDPARRAEPPTPLGFRSQSLRTDARRT